MVNATPLTGTGPQVVAQGIHSESVSALHDLGSVVHTNDGRILRYCKAGATALVMGKLQQASAEDTSNHQALTIANAAAGATSITTTTTVTLAVNALAGGLLTVESATTGAGQTLRIAGNTAATAAAVTIYLDDPVLVATTGTALIDVILNPYNGVVVNPTTATSAPVGAAVFNITAAYFGWLQVAGACSILMDGTGVVGTAQDASNATAGAVEPHPEAGVQAPVGTLITGVATTDYGFIKLDLL